MDGLRPKGHTGTADRPGGCTGRNILEIKNLGCWLVGNGEEEEEEESVEHRLSELSTVITATLCKCH